MSPKETELLKKLDVLTKKVDTLAIVTANLANQHQKALEGRTQTEQIQILWKRKLPKEAIALIVGTTLETVSVRLSEMKSKTKKENKKEDESG
jgi:ABC-type enterobactin transport system permease subunit